MVTDLCRGLDIDCSNKVVEIPCLIRQTPADGQPLPTDPAELQLLPVAGFAQLEILVSEFPATHRF